LLLLHSLHQTFEPTKQLTQIIYYITGAALHSALSLCKCEKKLTINDFEMAKNKLAYSGGYEEAKKNDCPADLVNQRSNKNLLFPVSELYDICLDMEKNILIPLLEKTDLLANLGNLMCIYLEREVQYMQYPESFTSVFEVALGLYPDFNTELTDERVESMHCDDYLPRILAEKFYRYYLGSCFNDFMKHKVRLMKCDLEFDNSVAFRISLISKFLKEKFTKLKEEILKERAIKETSVKKNKKKQNKKLKSKSSTTLTSASNSNITLLK